MINFRILGLVIFFLIIAYFGVVMVRTFNFFEAWVEYIPNRGTPSSTIISSGLILDVNEKKVILSIPNCVINDYPEKFFLHIYPIVNDSFEAPEFVNMDFNLAQEKEKIITLNGISICKYEKDLSHFNIQEVVIGQYELIDGNCCKILWSRHFIPSPMQGR